MPGSFAAWSPDAQCLATIDDPGGTVRLWDASPGYAFLSRVDYPVESIVRLLAHVNRAFEYFATATWDRVDCRIEQVLRLRPRTTSRSLLGVALRGRGEHDKAIADFTESVRFYPKMPWTYNARGDTYRWKGELDKAIVDYTEAIRLEPNFFYSRRSRAECYLRKGEHDKAIADDTEAIRLDPNAPWLYSFRAWAYLHKHEYERAIADYTEAIRLDPSNAWYWGGRGVTHYDKRDYDKAISDFKQAVLIAPEDAHFWFRRVSYRWPLAGLTSIARRLPKWSSAWARATTRGGALRGLGLRHNSGVSCRLAERTGPGRKGVAPPPPVTRVPDDAWRSALPDWFVRAGHPAAELRPIARFKIRRESRTVCPPTSGSSWPWRITALGIRPTRRNGSTRRGSGRTWPIGNCKPVF